MKARRTSGAIVAVGGADLTMRPEDEALYDYILALCETATPRICLLPTASGDPVEKIRSFHAAMERRDCVPSSISLFRLGDERIDLTSHLLAQDVIYVAGGSMVNLMALWREHGVDRILREAHRQGAVLCGYSAGSMCWFEHGVSCASGSPVPTRGLGILPGSHCVHYAQDRQRRTAYRELVAAGSLPAGLALDDHAAALFRDGRLAEAVRTRDSSTAHWVRSNGNGAAEEPIGTRLLESTTREQPDTIEEMRALRALRRSGRFRA